MGGGLYLKEGTRKPPFLKVDSINAKSKRRLAKTRIKLGLEAVDKRRLFQKKRFRELRPVISCSRDQDSAQLMMLGNGCKSLKLIPGRRSRRLLQQVDLVHGSGTGVVLRQIVRTRHIISPLVKLFCPGEKVEGGNGAQL